MPHPAPTTNTVMARLDAETVERLDRAAEKLSAQVPGTRLRRAAAVRAAILRGLDALEADEKTTKKSR